ncbi:hypothetical protein T484DRAFT_1778900 [Baffinella frigidus]|nr:hypothetical protein T484DRAFT_1778900 [Cryptophyta sp. CCMP2293]
MRSAAFAATRRPMARGWPCLAIASAARLALARPGLRMAGGGAGGGRCSTMLEGFSIETTPQTSAKVEDHSAILPAGTRVYVAAIPGVALEDVSALCARLKREGAPPETLNSNP